MKKSNFLKQDKEKRIEAVISDGQWYFFDKWRRVAKVKEEELNEWIEENKEHLIIDKATTKIKGVSTEVNVYRMDSEWILDWYKKHDISLKSEIVPKNFPVRLWDGKTETEHFLNNPPQFTSKVKIEGDDDVLEKVRDNTVGCGYIETSIDNPSEIFIYCLDADYMADVVKKCLTSKELKRTKIGVRRGYWNRDLSNFSEEFLTGMYKFYLPYSRSLLVKTEETMNMFLGSREEKDVRIIRWITIAMEKYDDSKNIPFSGYLASMLARRPYELPDEYYGRKLSKFKNNRSRAEERLSKRASETSFTDEEIAGEMGLDLDEYKKLNREFTTLENFRNATTYEWESAEDSSMSDEDADANDFELAYEISKAAVEAYIKTNCYEDAMKLINNIGTNEKSIINLDLSLEYKLALGEILEKYHD